MESTSFKNVDDEFVTVVMNKTDEAINYKLITPDGQATLKIPAHAIQSLVY